MMVLESVLSAMAFCGPSINRRLLPVKASSFFFMAALASLFPYLGIYMKQVGLTPVEAGIINGLVPFLSAAMRPLVGALADRLRAHKILLLLCCVLTGLFFGSLLFVPHRSEELQTIDARNITVHCSAASTGNFSNHCVGGCDRINCANGLLNNDTEALIHENLVWKSTKTCRISCKSEEYVPDSGELEFQRTSRLRVLEVAGIYRVSNSSCLLYYVHSSNDEASTGNVSVRCQDLLCINDCKLLENVTDTSGQHTACDITFWSVFIAFLGANLALAPVCSLIDAIIYAYLGDERDKYGQQRVWGTIGYGVFAAISGISMNAYRDPKDEAKKYTPAFILYAVLTFFTALLVSFYKISPNFHRAEESSVNVCKVLKQLRVVSLLFLLLIFGMFTGLIETFLYWHLTTLGGTKLLFGLCLLVSVVPEIPFMFLSGSIIKKLGQINMLYLTATVYAIRLTAYYFLEDPWLVLAIEPLHGIAFGLMYPAATSYISVITPAGMHGVMQGLISGVQLGLGRGCGVLLSGLLYEQYGALTFLMFGIVAVISLLTYWLLQTFVINRLEPLVKLRNSNLAEQQKMMDSSTDEEPDSSKEDVMDENTDTL